MIIVCYRYLSSSCVCCRFVSLADAIKSLPDPEPQQLPRLATSHEGQDREIAELRSLSRAGSFKRSNLLPLMRKMSMSPKKVNNSVVLGNAI
jgi:hypothetical protein